MAKGQDGNTPELSERCHMATFKGVVLPTAHGNDRVDFALKNQRHGGGVSHTSQLLPERSRTRVRIERVNRRPVLGDEPPKLWPGDPPAVTRLGRWAGGIEPAFNHHPLTVYPQEGGPLSIYSGRHPFQ